METEIETTKKVSKKTPTKKAVETGAPEVIAVNQTGKSIGKIALAESVFGLPWNKDLVHQVAVSMMANARAGTAHTKDRSEVSGGGKKPWKQKGTGRARHGSTRSPIWVGGGVTFGPRNDKDYSKKINKKMRVKALYTVLSKRAHDGQMLALDALTLAAPKTKDAAVILSALSKTAGFEKLTSSKKTTALIVVPEMDAAVAKSFANLPGVFISTARELNPLIVMQYQHVLVVDAPKVTEALVAKMK